MKNDVKGLLLGIIALVIFIMGFVCLIIGGESSNVPLVMFGLGSMFLFSGICVLIIKQKIGLPFTIAGFIMLSYTISEWFGNGLVGKFLENNFSFLFGLVFFLAGLCLFWNIIGIRLWKRHFYCTIPVTVKVIDTEEDTMYTDCEYTSVYSSTYQYNYNGKNYTIASEYFDNITPHSGEFIAYLNPNNPEEIVIPLLKLSKIVITVLSLASMIGGICCMFLFIKDKL